MYPSRNIRFNADGDMIQDREVDTSFGAEDVVAAILMTIAFALFALIVQLI